MKQQVMNDAELKRVVQTNSRRPDLFRAGDRVVVRAPERGENKQAWSAYNHHVGRVGTIRNDVAVNHDSTTTVIFTDTHSAMRTQWLELAMDGTDTHE